MKNIDFNGVVLSVPNKTNRVVYYHTVCEDVYHTHTYELYNLALGATPNSSSTVEHLGTFVLNEVLEQTQNISSSREEKYFDADGKEVVIVHHDNAPWHIVSRNNTCRIKHRHLKFIVSHQFQLAS